MTTIETTDQADALPVGSVLRLASGQVYARIDTADDGADWQTIGDTYCWGAAEMLNEHPGPATVLHDPTQPAPAGVINREAIARIITTHEGAWSALLVADAILDLLHTRTVAQVKAEGLRELAATVRASWAPSKCPWVGALDDEATRLEREDKR